jgi:hypothetical protein
MMVSAQSVYKTYNFTIHSRSYKPTTHCCDSTNYPIKIKALNNDHEAGLTLVCKLQWCKVPNEWEQHVRKGEGRETDTQ